MLTGDVFILWSPVAAVPWTRAISLHVCPPALPAPVALICPLLYSSLTQWAGDFQLMASF